MARGERDVRADLDIAARRIGRAVWTARLAVILLVGIAAIYAFQDADWNAVLVTAGAGLLVLALAEGMRRGSQLAAWAMLTAYTAAIVLAYMLLDHPPGILAPLVMGYRLFDGVRGAIDLADLRKEFVAVHVPREPQAGDVYSVRQGTQFGAAKLLVHEPERIHIRMLHGRFDSREATKSAVSSSAEYEHLPLDLSAFLGWEPQLVRAEPVLPEELRGYETWARLRVDSAPRAALSPAAE